MKIIYRMEASRILKVNPKTFDKYVARGYLAIQGHIGRIRFFDKKDVLTIKKKMVKKRKKGLSLFIP